MSAVLTESALVADGDLGMDLFRRGPGSISRFLNLKTIFSRGPGFSSQGFLRFPTVSFGVAVCRILEG